MSDYATLPAYLRRDMRRIHGRLYQPKVWPLTMDAMLAAVSAVVARGMSAVLESWQWRTASQFGARPTIAAVEHRLPVRGTFYRRGDLLIFEGRPS